jgi:hypothetical protein
LLILFSLGCGDGAGSDDSDSRVVLSVNDEDQAPLDGPADGDPAVFIVRVLVVGESRTEGIIEDGCGFVEGHPMFFEVGGGFGRVELEAEHRIRLWVGAGLEM